MTIQLTNQEKVQIINSKIRNCNFSKYGFQVDLISENAKTSPNTVLVASLNESISEVDSQIAALNTELAKYPVEEE